tara:strand:- start:685 stop:1332 length:648 start_codon:yes stop_codon:yes gene_type:complete
MGWFSKSNDAPAQTFGTPTYGGMGMANQMGGGNNAMMGGGGMGAMMMSQQAQNPMMQQMANDPITATARLLDFNDPVSDFIVSQNFAMLIELMGGVVTLAVKEFFSSVKFKLEGDHYVIDTSSMPAQLSTMSPENLQLTLQQVQNNVNMGIQQRQQQQQMFLMAHNPMSLQNNQPGFFGSLLGGMLGNQVQQQGGMGQMMGNAAKAGAAMAPMGL